MDPHILNLTLLTSLRTGNIILDLIIAAMIPTMLSHFWNKLSEHWYKLVAVLRRWKDSRTTEYRRHIAHTKTTPFDMDSDDGANHVLQNAIRMYIGSQLPAEYLRGKVKLSELKSGEGNKHYNPYDDDSDNDGNDEDKPADEKAKSALSNGGLKILNLPDTTITPIEIMPGLLFTENVNMDDHPENEEEKRNSNTKMSELVFTLISPGHKGKTGKEIVDGFIKTVLEWYTAEVAKREDDSRWMYQPLVASKGSDRLYKRYQLSSEKTFNSLFFNDKARVIRVLDAFTNKTGKYKIKGFPHRLSMLFHGPPGTGKTSLVKAIALYTKRHVVSVPLSRMKTNQEFMDVMMDCVFKYCVAGKKDDNEGDGGESSNTKRAQLSYENIVFLLEDVDAASTVVHRKKKASSESEDNKRSSEPSAPVAAPPADAPKQDDEEHQMGREETAAFPADGALTIDTGAGANEDDTDPKSPTPSAASPVEAPPITKVESVSAAGSDDSDSDASEQSRKNNRKREKKDKSNATTEHLAKMCQMLIQQNQMSSAQAKGTFSFGDFLLDDEDTLSLESILTVLDGVIDTPGRILVMTTNHPEKLDPALIRNGRINMKLYMGHLNSTQVEQMAAHYYPEADKLGVFNVVEAFKALGTYESGRDAATGVVSTTKISPAEFEQMCAECVEIKDLENRLLEMASKLQKTPSSS